MNPRITATTPPTRSASARARRRARRGSEVADAGLRGRVLLHVEGTPAAVQRRSAEIQPEGQAGARPLRPDFQARPRRSRRLRAAAGAADDGARPALDQRAVVPARRDALSAARRFADGLPPAARFAAVGARNPNTRGTSRRTRRAALSEFPASRPAGSLRRTTGASWTRPPPASIARARNPQADRPWERKPGDRNPPSWITRTALCVEPRDGRLHVFLPPVDETEDFLDLVAAIEQTAESLKMPVILEGTPPGYDPRHQRGESHARPRRHRGEPAARRLVGRTRSATPRCSTRKRTSAAWPRRNS